MSKLSLVPHNLLSSQQIKELIDDALKYEASQNIEQLAETLALIWSDFNRDPDVSMFSTLHQAKIKRIIGSFLLKIGELKDICNFVDRGRDQLCEAERLFFLCDRPSDAAHANVLSGFAYYVEKRFDEFRIFLEKSDSIFSTQKSPTFALIKVHWLLYYWKTEQPAPALEIIKNFGATIEEYGDAKTVSQFYNQAGLIYRQTNQFDLAIEAYRKGISISQDLKDDLSVACRLNNLAFLYLSQNETLLALNCADEAIKVYTAGRNLSGWIAQFLDTRAQILYARREYYEALKTINKSLDYFSGAAVGKDTLDALFLKIKILIRLEQQTIAGMLFESLIKKTIEEIGNEIGAKRYELDLKKEFGHDLEAIFRYRETLEVVRVERPATDNTHKFMTNRKNLIYLKVSPAFAEKYLFRSEAAILCVEIDGYFDASKLILLKNLTSDGYLVGEVFYKNGFWFAEDTFSQEIINLKHEHIQQIGKIVAISDLMLDDDDEVLFYEA